MENINITFKINENSAFFVNIENGRFATSACKLKLNGKYEMLGQCQHLVTPNNFAIEGFFLKHKLHIKQMTAEQYNEIKADIELLKRFTPYIEHVEYEIPLQRLKKLLKRW